MNVFHISRLSFVQARRERRRARFRSSLPQAPDGALEGPQARRERRRRARPAPRSPRRQTKPPKAPRPADNAAVPGPLLVSLDARRSHQRPPGPQRTPRAARTRSSLPQTPDGATEGPRTRRERLFRAARAWERGQRVNISHTLAPSCCRCQPSKRRYQSNFIHLPRAAQEGPSPTGRAARVEKVVTMNRQTGGEGFQGSGRERPPAGNEYPTEETGMPCPWRGGPN